MNNYIAKQITQPYHHLASAFILVAIKADLRSNSELLEGNLTRRAANNKGAGWLCLSRVQVN